MDLGKLDLAVALNAECGTHLFICFWASKLRGIPCLALWGPCQSLSPCLLSPHPVINHSPESCPSSCLFISFSGLGHRGVGILCGGCPAALLFSVKTQGTLPSQGLPSIYLWAKTQVSVDVILDVSAPCWGCTSHFLWITSGREYRSS